MWLCDILCFTSKWKILFISVLAALVAYIIVNVIQDTSTVLQCLSLRMDNQDATKHSIACNQIPAEQSFRRGSDLYNENYTLADVDHVAAQEIDKHICNSLTDPKKEKFIIIVPYRDRKRDLLAFLIHVYPYFDRQGVRKEIMVLEQNGRAPFNRAKLFNAAIRELDMINQRPSPGALERLAGITCFALHDVDKLPDNPDIPYHCSDGPHQLLRYWKRPKESIT